MLLLVELWVLLPFVTWLEGAPPCRLGDDLLNSLVNDKNKDEDEFGIENIFGLVGNNPGNVTEDLTSKELSACVQAYLDAVSGQKDKLASVNLHYEQPPHLGEPLGIPVPVPEDEDYLPDETGYTTYINPHNFKEKGVYKGESGKRPGRPGTQFYDDVIDAFEEAIDEWF